MSPLNPLGGGQSPQTPNIDNIDSACHDFRLPVPHFWIRPLVAQPPHSLLATKSTAPIRHSSVVRN